MKRWVKWIGYGAAGLVVLVLVAACALFGFSEARYRKQYAVTPATIRITADSAAIARGNHLVHSSAGCIDCHGENLGGGTVIDQPPLGRIFATNLTRGKGGAGTLTDAQYVLAIRHGIAPNGTPLKIMPSSDYANFSDEDLAAVIAYVKSVPAVDKELPANSVGPLGRALFMAGQLPFLHAERVDHERKHLAAVPPAATAGYGAYLAGFGCKGCHGPALAGGKIVDGPPDWPPAANLTPSGPTKDWTEADFTRLLREGKRPNGIPVNQAMPWRFTRNMTDDEIHALYLYMKSLPSQTTVSS
ncbi:MAG: cytochrome c class [Gemmatimonadetes bacterium]|nr:cytochrome c class [Gemmatimonadota bacterium]